MNGSFIAAAKGVRLQLPFLISPTFNYAGNFTGTFVGPQPPTMRVIVGLLVGMRMRSFAHGRPAIVVPLAVR